jgi:hypothetical protein
MSDWPLRGPRSGGERAGVAVAEAVDAQAFALRMMLQRQFWDGVLQPALAVRVASSAAWQEWPMSRLVVPLSWRYARREPG